MRGGGGNSGGWRGRGSAMRVERFWLIASAIFLFSALASSPPLAKNETSTCGGARSPQIARLDDSGKRVFVISNLREVQTRTSAKAEVVAVAAGVHRCRPDWGTAWSASFFTNAKYAGYKTEASLRKYVEDGTWGRAYVAEYDASSAKMTLLPAGKSSYFQFGDR